MPTYHYRCSDCGHSFDQFQKFAEDPLTICPECGGPIRRIPQPVGIVFKGSGWYINDSRKQNGDSKSSSTAESKAESTSDKSSKDEKSGTDSSKSTKTEKSETKASA